MSKLHIVAYLYRTFGKLLMLNGFDPTNLLSWKSIILITRIRLKPFESDGVNDYSERKDEFADTSKPFRHQSSRANVVLNAGKKLLEQTEMSSKFYFKKEIPNALGGLKIGIRKLVVVTGASSGLGLTAASILVKNGRSFVIMACRNIEKAEKVAKKSGMPDGSYSVLKLELASLKSVRNFVDNLKAFKSARPLTHLICNAAVYRPTEPEPAFTDDVFELTLRINHLGHFLLVNLLLDNMKKEMVLGTVLLDLSLETPILWAEALFTLLLILVISPDLRKEERIQ
mmetsp:Transcript_44161/g.53048  ORF Transcript_44161/g.53048 Transcript_44161/m.53048 type:complete len:285 (-) Transcript_44161:731-1585(-)